MVLIVVACAHDEGAHNSVRELRRTQASRSAPTPFAEIAGLTRVIVSTLSYDDFGSSTDSRLEVMRAGHVVCVLPFGGSSHHEHSSSYTTAELEVPSRDPLRVHVRLTTTSDGLGAFASSRCVGFEFPARSSCRELFEHTCLEPDACKLTSATSVVAGTGHIRGHVIRDGEALSGAMLAYGTSLEVADATGAFAFAAGAGTYEIKVVTETGFYKKGAVVSLAADEDAEVAITITCDCCAP